MEISWGDWNDAVQAHIHTSSWEKHKCWISAHRCVGEKYTDHEYSIHMHERDCTGESRRAFLSRGSETETKAG